MISLHCKQTEYNISLVEQYTNVTCQPFSFAQLNLARYSANIAMPSLSVYDYIIILVNCQVLTIPFLNINIRGLRGVEYQISLLINVICTLVSVNTTYT